VLSTPALGRIEWVSPLREDGFAEYRDASFLRRLDLDHLAYSLGEFWPRRGPQWDALGQAAEKTILVEAKARLPEFVSPASQASKASLLKIEGAFARVKQDLGIDQGFDWTQEYYQYANRIAHLWWLRENGVDAHLMFVDFMHDADVGGPSDIQTWRQAYAGADARLGLPPRHALSPYMHHVYPDTRLLE
jgi:hypothetical protein